MHYEANVQGGGFHGSAEMPCKVFRSADTSIWISDSEQQMDPLLQCMNLAWTSSRYERHKSEIFGC